MTKRNAVWLIVLVIVAITAMTIEPQPRSQPSPTADQPITVYPQGVAR